MSAPENPRDGQPSVGQKRLIWTALTVAALAALLVVAGLAFMGFLAVLSWSFPILMPLGLAVLVALVAKPVVDFLENHGWNRMVTTLVVCVLLVLGFIVFWAFILPPIYNEAVGFAQDMPKKINDATQQLLKETSSMNEVHGWLEANLPAFPTTPPG
jgi:predicted PurR-regulated permease PerM